MRVLIIGGTGLISTAITRALIARGDNVTLYNRGQTKADIPACHRDDVGQAFAEAVGNEKTFGKSYHTASEEPMTWNQYHQTVAQAMNAPEPELVHIPTDLLFEIAPKTAEWCRENFQYNNIFDNTAAKTDLNFRYTIPFVEGVPRIVDWLDTRGRIHNRDEPEIYSEIIERWRHLSAKETFFRGD